MKSQSELKKAFHVDDEIKQGQELNKSLSTLTINSQSLKEALDLKSQNELSFLCIVNSFSKGKKYCGLSARQFASALGCGVKTVYTYFDKFLKNQYIIEVKPFNRASGQTHKVKASPQVAACIKAFYYNFRRVEVYENALWIKEQDLRRDLIKIAGGSIPKYLTGKEEETKTVA